MADQPGINWQTCTEDGCIGIRLAVAPTCLAHASDEERNATLKQLGKTGDLDARGVPITEALLEQILAAAPRDTYNRPTFRATRFDRATFQDDARFVRVTEDQLGAGPRPVWATFQGDGPFAGAIGDRLDPRLTSVGVTFQEDAWFSEATFHGDAWFTEATFHGDVRFGGVTFQGDAKFDGVTFHGDAEFDFAAIPGGTWFGQLFRQSMRGASTFQGGAEFSKATFQGKVRFGGVTFRGNAWFSEATFQGVVWFSMATIQGVAWFSEGVTFQDYAWFNEVTFEGEAWFSKATFQGDAWFGEATFQRKAVFGEAVFERARQVGPLLAYQGLVLDDVRFAQPVRIEASTPGLCCRRARFAGGVQFRLRWARVVLDDADLAAPSMLTGIPRLTSDDLVEREQRIARAWQRLLGEEISERPRLVSLQRANVAGLGLGNVELADCRFAGAHNLDRLRLEADVSFAAAPVWLWWDWRQVIAEERAWRARRSSRWASPLWPAWAGERPAMLEAGQIAGLYRALRKGREDAKDEPGAGDFYYGEMEMRRHARRGRIGGASRGRVERAILTAYWLVSGHRLRAWRALAWLATLTAALAVAFHLVGFTRPPQPHLYWTSLLYAFRSTLSLADDEVKLTAWGKLLQALLRLTGPLLLGLALLAVRGRVKPLTRSPARLLRRQSADLLRQLPVAEVPTWAVAAVCDGRVARVCCDNRLRGPMGEVVRLPGGMVTLQEAVDAFLDHHDLARSTRRVYRASLASLVAEMGPATAVGELSGTRLAGWFRSRYAGAAPATWNRELATLRAAVGWWRRCGWLAADPTDGLERRRERVDRTRALTRRELERLFARRDLPLRERTLWRLLYETAARANELLALDVEDLDLANRRARVHSKGGAVEWVFWQTGSAQLLPRLLAGRTSGPVFLGDRRPARAVAGLDLDPTSARARLSYRRAAELFRACTGWTLHQLRHSALTHAAEDGTNLPLLLARSRHASVRSLERYARPGPEAVARHLAETDPARRRP